MSNQKIAAKTTSEAKRAPRDLKGVPVSGEKKSALDVEVLSLGIEEDFEIGGDPYNHTGSHCIIEPRDDD